MLRRMWPIAIGAVLIPLLLAACSDATPPAPPTAAVQNAPIKFNDRRFRTQYNLT
jgi:hypothetical protein